MRMIELWQTGMMNYTDIGLEKPVKFTEEFLQTIANDTENVDVTDEHSNNIIGSISQLKCEDGVLYGETSSELDLTGKGLSPVFNCDFVDKGSYYEPINYKVTSVGLTTKPRNKILYNSIETSFVTNGKGDEKVSDELRAMLDKKEETIAEQREEIGILKKQMEELRSSNEDSKNLQKELQKAMKDLDEIKAKAETYKIDADKLHEQEANRKAELIKEIVGEDEKGMEMFQKHSVEELEYMKDTKIITEPNKGINGDSVDTLTDGDGDDNPNGEVDEYSAEYFEKWEKENTHW